MMSDVTKLTHTEPGKIIKNNDKQIQRNVCLGVRMCVSLSFTTDVQMGTIYKYIYVVRII